MYTNRGLLSPGVCQGPGSLCSSHAPALCFLAGGIKAPTFTVRFLHVISALSLCKAGTYKLLFNYVYVNIIVFYLGSADMVTVFSFPVDSLFFVFHTSAGFHVQTVFSALTSMNFHDKIS